MGVGALARGIGGRKAHDRNKGGDWKHFEHDILPLPLTSRLKRSLNAPSRHLAAEKGKFFLFSDTVIWPIDRANGRTDPSLTRHALMV
jgi:hypothetical protein